MKAPIKKKTVAKKKPAIKKPKPKVTVKKKAIATPAPKRVSSGVKSLDKSVGNALRKGKPPK